MTDIITIGLMAVVLVLCILLGWWLREREIRGVRRRQKPPLYVCPPAEHDDLAEIGKRLMEHKYQPRGRA